MEPHAARLVLVQRRVDEAAGAIELILTRSDTVRVLATSREGLSVSGERLVPVPPVALDGSATASPSAVEPSSNVQCAAMGSPAPPVEVAVRTEPAFETDFRMSLTWLPPVSAVLRSGWLTTGGECKRFEAEFARFVGVRHALAVNSCTAALHLALEAAGIRPGDLVLVPTLTFAATAEVVIYCGATPVLVDCEPETLNIDVSAAETSQGKRGRARRRPRRVPPSEQRT